jgi:hypothetical protein
MRTFPARAGALAFVLFLALSRPAAAESDATAATYARQWWAHLMASLNPREIRSAELRFIRTRTTPANSLRMQFLSRLEGKRWLDIWEMPLPPGDVSKLLEGDRIPNTDRAGARMRVQWGDASTTYIAMASSFNGTLIRPPRRAPGLANEGELTSLLSEIGFYYPPLDLAGRRVEMGPGPYTFTLHHPEGRSRTVFRSSAALAAKGLPESVSLYFEGGLMQRRRYTNWHEYNGVWLPQRMVQERFYDPSEPIVGNYLDRKPLPSPHTTYTWELLDARINVPLKPEELALKISENALIFDERFGFRFQYRYRASMTEEELLALAEKARRERELQRQAGVH